MALVDLWQPQQGVRRILDRYGRGEEKLPVFKMPHLRGWSIAGKYAYLPAVGRHEVLVVDTSTWQEAGRIAVKGPAGICHVAARWPPDLGEFRLSRQWLGAGDRHAGQQAGAHAAARQGGPAPGIHAARRTGVDLRARRPSGDDLRHGELCRTGPNRRRTRLRASSSRRAPPASDSEHEERHEPHRVAPAQRLSARLSADAGAVSRHRRTAWRGRIRGAGGARRVARGGNSQPRRRRLCAAPRGGVHAGRPGGAAGTAVAHRVHRQFPRRRESQLRARTPAEPVVRRHGRRCGQPCRPAAVGRARDGVQGHRLAAGRGISYRSGFRPASRQQGATPRRLCA